MTKNYEVEFAYSVPEWSDVTLSADNEEEAKILALKEIEEIYPEAVDVSIIDVKEI